MCCRYLVSAVEQVWLILLLGCIKLLTANPVIYCSHFPPLHSPFLNPIKSFSYFHNKTSSGWTLELPWMSSESTKLSPQNLSSAPLLNVCSRRDPGCLHNALSWMSSLTPACCRVLLSRPPQKHPKLCAQHPLGLAQRSSDALYLQGGVCVCVCAFLWNQHRTLNFNSGLLLPDITLQISAWDLVWTHHSTLVKSAIFLTQLGPEVCSSSLHVAFHVLRF